MGKTTFTDLYDDILIDIFSYFSLEEIVFSFNNIIPDLPSVIQNSHIRSLDEYTIENVLPYIDLSQVISCKLNPSGGLKAEQLAYLFRFSRLRSLILRNAIVLENGYFHLLASEDPDTIMDILSADTIQLLDCVFNFIPTLKRFHFQANNIKINLNDVQENLSRNIFSNIQYLKLDILCSWSALPQILMATPCLRALYTITEPDLTFELPVSPPDNLRLLSLHTLDLTSKDVDLVELAELLKYMPNLKYCRLHGRTVRMNEPLIESDRWRTFFDEDVVQLKRFTVHYLVAAEESGLWFRHFNSDSYFAKINFKIRLYEGKEHDVLRIEGDYKR